MLVHIDQTDVAERVHNAWLRTIEDGIHTYDIYDDRVSKSKVGTKEFAQAVVARVGQRPQKLKAVSYAAAKKEVAFEASSTAKRLKKDMVGIDVSLQWELGKAADLGAQLETLARPYFKLTMVSNRGVKVYPGGFEETFLSDNWRCRFHSATGKDNTVSHARCRLVKRWPTPYSISSRRSLCAISTARERIRWIKVNSGRRT
jgi:isocitrate dehydrogenase